MKKLLAVIIAIFCLSSVSVLAQDIASTESVGTYGVNEISSINDDYLGLYLNGEYFVNFNLGDTDYSVLKELNATVNLNQTQKETIENVNVSANSQKNVLRVIYNFKNGSTFTSTYIKERYLEEYQLVKSEGWYKGEINFYWPEDNTIEIIHSQLLGEKSDVAINKADSWESFDVYAISGDGGYRVEKGTVLVNEDVYYYLDFNEANVDSDKFYVFDYEMLPLYKITDQTLIDSIEKAIQEYYGDDYGFFDDDKFTQTVSDILLSVVFCIVPAVIFVIFLIAALRSKTKYRKIFRLIYILALLCLLLFIILFCIL